jgi:hypothetical protein
MKATSATSVTRSTTPIALVALAMAVVLPTSVTMSPRFSLVSGRIGISVAMAPRVILRRNSPRAIGMVASSAKVLPSTSLLVT